MKNTTQIETSKGSVYNINLEKVSSGIKVSMKIGFLNVEEIVTDISAGHFIIAVRKCLME